MNTKTAHTQNNSGESQPTTNNFPHARDLTQFQLQCLLAIADEPKHGLGLKDELDVYYQEQIHHGRLYPNLDTLVEKGLVEKDEEAIDRRTNLYSISEAGEHLLREFAQRVIGKLGLSIETASDDESAGRYRSDW